MHGAARGVRGEAVAPLHVPDTTQPVTALSWAPVYPARVPARAKAAEFPQAARAIFTPDVTQPVPVLAWQPSIPTRVWGRRRTADLRQFVAPVFVPDVTQPAPVLAWGASLPTPRAVQARRLLSGVTVLEVPAPAVVPPLSWAPPLPLPVRRQGPLVQYAPVTGPVEIWVDWVPPFTSSQPPRRRLPVLGGLVGPVAPVAAAAPLPDLPMVLLPGPGPRARRPLTGGTIGPVLPIPPAPIDPMAWAAMSELPVRRDGPAIQYAPITGPVEGVVPWGWQPLQTLPRWRRLAAQAGHQITRLPDVVAPVVPALSWQPSLPVPVRRRVPVRAVAAAFVQAVAPVVLVRGWDPILPGPLRRRPVRLQPGVAPFDLTPGGVVFRFGPRWSFLPDATVWTWGYGAQGWQWYPVAVTTGGAYTTPVWHWSVGVTTWEF